MQNALRKERYLEQDALRRKRIGPHQAVLTQKKILHNYQQQEMPLWVKR